MRIIVQEIGHNRYMKKSDIIILSIAVCLVSGGMLAYITESFVVGILSAIIFMIISFLIFSMRKKSNRISKEAFIQDLLLEGKNKSNEYIRKLFPNITDGELMIQNSTLIMNKIRYSSIGEEDIADCYRQAITNNCNKVILFSNNADKKALNLSYKLPITITVYNYRKLYSLLKEKDLLPDKPSINLKKRGIKAIILDLRYIPVKYFAISSISTALLSLIVPLRIYYLVFATINAIIGITISIINKKADLHTKK